MGHERITVHPTRMGGVPTIRDTRVTVGMVLGQLAAGHTFDEVLADYPYLDRDDIRGALEFAAVWSWIKEHLAHGAQQSRQAARAS